MIARQMRNSLAALLLFLPALMHAAATIVIQNGDGPNVGFNDPTPVAPVGGNTGTTLGEQRLIAFQAAADKWGQTLNSIPTITVLASWPALSCTSTSAVLGSAGAASIWRNFIGAPRTNTWYGAALANSISAIDLNTARPEIQAQFNVNLGKTGCLDGMFFDLGLDGNHGDNVDLVTVLTHEFAHGLGFSTFTNGQTGAEQDDGTGVGPLPSIWDYFLFDTAQNLTWAQMTAAQRVTSSLSEGNLVWTGANVLSAVPQVLQLGTPQLSVTGPGAFARTFQVGTASFGPQLATPGVSGEVMPVVDTAPSTGLACAALSPLNRTAISGKIALIDRGTCTFPVKAKMAQDAGAIGVIIADNVAGTPPAGLGGSDPTITIPAVRITLDDATTLKSYLANRSRQHSGIFANLGLNPLVRAGADSQGRPWLYAPNPFQPGSSVSHWDVSLFPNQLMEPNINQDLTHEVSPPKDMTFPLLLDIGWR